jgi:chaperonin GroES
MKLKPLHDRVIVKRLEETEEKIGGIIVPDTAREKPQRGRIVAVGEGRARKDGGRIAPDVRVGDLVAFGKYSGQEIKLAGEEFLIMKEEDVLLVFDAGERARTAPAAGKSAGSTAPASQKKGTRRPATAAAARRSGGPPRGRGKTKERKR